MEEVKSLQLEEEANTEPTGGPLEARIRALEASSQVRNAGAGQPSEEPPLETVIQAVFKEAEEGRSPEQLKQAENWVTRQMGGRLKVQQGPAGEPGQERILEIVFDKYVATQELRGSGKTTLPDGFTVTHSCGVPILARYYIKIILDQESYQNDTEKLLAVVADSEKRRSHPAEFQHLFDETGLLKPLRRGRKKERT